MCSKHILLIEAYYGGSHKQLIDLVHKAFPSEMFTLPAKKWHWRSLTSSLYFADVIPKVHDFRYLFASSVVPLAELIALRPDLAKLHKILYFHENQMIYPVREKKSRYFQHGYNEVLSCLVADRVLFNSHFNKESFLSSLTTYFNMIPDHRPKNLEAQIRPKCSVLYFPLILPQHLKSEKKPVLPCEHLPSDKITSIGKQEKLHIVWPHRWEHDKNPEDFFEVLFRLKDNGLPFYLSVIGERFTETPEIFDKASEYLKEHILNWGYKDSKEDYYKTLSSGDIVVSTSKHEFFGVSMLEAVSFGCYPLCPKRLVYPEIYSDDYLYTTTNQLYKRLKYFCQKPYVPRNHKIQVDFSRFSWEFLKKSYSELFEVEK